MDRTHRYRPLLPALLPAVVALLLYWPTLRLPLLFDDLLHIRLVKEMNWATVWLPSEKFGFYRPLVFLPFLVIKALFGRYPAPLLHGLNVAQQAANAFLVTLLAWRLWPRWPRALATGLLLAAYPLAYQALAFYGNNVYPASAGLILLALHTYLLALQPGHGRRWWLVTGFLFLAGLFSHETTILFGPLAALLHWSYLTSRQHNYQLPITNLQSPISNPSAWLRTSLQSLIPPLRPALLFTLLGGLYAVLYQFLPTGGGPQLDAGGNAPWPKLLYVLQSAVYPFAWFAHRLPTLSANAVILGGLVLTLALTAWAARRPAERPALVLGWGWWGLASVLLAVNLPTYYLEHGARLFYLGGVGLALLWATLLDSLLRLPRIGRLAWAVVLGLIVISSALFVRGRLAALAGIASPLAVVEEVMAGRPAEEGLLLVNLPAWASPPRNTYATGVEYVTLLGDHLFAEELLAENLGGSRPILAVAIPDLLANPGYPYGVHEQAPLEAMNSRWAPAGWHVFITGYRPAGIETRYTGQATPGTPGSSPLALFGPYALTAASAVHCGNQMTTTLTWQPTSPGTPSTASIFVQLLDGNGALVAQADGPPLGLRPDLFQLLPGWQLIDRRTLQPAGDPAQLLVGVYDYVTGQRYPAQDSQDRPLPANALSLSITPCQGYGD
ncbi:MAG: hypothetical protein L0332_17295 [Chloroflexi bacterium]|nr:hypothetical protein [Chloroflexota bacterium]MCI0643743.1 hypothetical protein [Chloroflexota bacterium]MCI0728456.1 hypothetical protein [Chloroflexota bacterium]